MNSALSMKRMDFHTLKELESDEEQEASMEIKVRTDCKKTTRTLIDLKEPAAAVEEEEEEEIEGKKFCTFCKTTKTPLWRIGPSGPKSLCNACGIRYRKKKRTTPSPSSNSGSGSPEEKDDKFPKCLSKSVKMNLVILRKDWLLESTNVGKKHRRQRKRKLREEEIAAASLVALSCGAVFA